MVQRSIHLIPTLSVLFNLLRYYPSSFMGLPPRICLIEPNRDIVFVQLDMFVRVSGYYFVRQFDPILDSQDVEVWPLHLALFVEVNAVCYIHPFVYLQ